MKPPYLVRDASRGHRRSGGGGAGNVWGEAVKQLQDCLDWLAYLVVIYVLPVHNRGPIAWLELWLLPYAGRHTAPPEMRLYDKRQWH